MEGSAPIFFAIKYMVDNLWRNFGQVKIITGPHGKFWFKFQYQIMSARAMETLWYVGGKPMFWEVGMNLEDIATDTFLIWIKMEKIP